METSVVSYLAARPSKDPVIAGQQMSTLRWWREKRGRYDLFISKLVWLECAEGNPDAVARRLKFIRPLRWLQVTSAVTALAQALVIRKAVPANAGSDALHISLGAIYQVQFLLTWNFTHINNPDTEEQIRTVCHEHGFHCPVICSPDQLTLN